MIVADRVIARELDGRKSDGTSYRIALYQRDLVDYKTIIDRIARAYDVQTQFLNLKVLEHVRPPPDTSSSRHMPNTPTLVECANIFVQC